MEGELYFANADTVRGAVRPPRQGPGVHAVVVDAVTIPSVDVTAVRMLVELSETLAAGGIELVIARDIGQVRDVLGRAGDDVDATTVYPSVAAAVDAVRTAPPSATG